MGISEGSSQRSFFPCFLTIIFLPLWILGVVPVTSLLYGDEQYNVPEDERIAYRVGIMEFSIPPEMKEVQYAGRSLPLLLLENLQNCKNHSLNNKEREKYKIRMVEEKIRKEKLNIEKLRNALNSVYLTSEDTIEERERLEKDLSQSKAYITYLKGLDVSQITIKKEKEVKIVNYKDKEQLFPLPVVSMIDLARQHSLDLIIRGRVERVEDYFYLRISIWSWVDNAEITVFETASILEELGGKIDLYSNRVKTIVLGRTWGDLLVEVNPPAADVYVDGRYHGSGKVRANNLTTGTHTISVNAKGYKPLETSIFIKSEQKIEKKISLERMKINKVWITSYPDGADLYVASQWAGKTPLEIELPLEEEMVFLRKKGYADERVVLEEEDSIRKIYMHSLDADTEAIIDQKRDNFYTSLGLFALSIPIPLFSWGLGFQNSEGFYMAADSMNLEEMEKYKLNSNRYYHAYLGGLVLAGALFANAIIHLIDYIVAGNTLR